METLRFAPIIRVSTERQEARGESLRTQKTQITEYVESLHGVIPDTCWQYSGQEHATPGQERLKLEKLLEDSGKGIFDAVIVCDASRWSRDNAKSKEGLKILRDNEIKFFVGTMEFDLFNPAQKLYLGMSAEIGEFQAKEQSRKSINSRIHRAKRGVPTSGWLPYGRTWNKETEKWGIDYDKKLIIEQSAQRYLAGESLIKIAQTFDMDFTNLWSILNKRSGTEWPCRFHYENINEKVIMTIPRLLDDDTINAIHKMAKAKKTYTHGHSKNKYLLSRMIFCSRCGYALFGNTDTRTGKKYYRHARYPNKECKVHKFVPASEIESAVLIQLVRTLGDVERINNAIKQATPDISKVKSLEKEQTNLTNEAKKIIIQKDKVVDKVAEGLLTDTEVKTKLDKLRAREASINTRLINITEELNSVPDPVKVKRLTALGIKVLRDVTKNSPEKIFKKSYEWKRNLIEHAFAGTDVRGKRFGVYVDKTEDGWKFEIRGTLESTILSLPLSDQYLINAFHLDSEYQDIKEELNKIRDNVSNMGQDLQGRYHVTSGGQLL